MTWPSPLAMLCSIKQATVLHLTPWGQERSSGLSDHHHSLSELSSDSPELAVLGLRAPPPAPALDDLGVAAPLLARAATPD
mmetsp:Transcript_20703/g.32411  ORF Transcript_20703/g.32411 Transcript_20703/m.32411 type:complete len:81 (-) Transcript_20703:1584-1826(-)